MPLALRLVRRVGSIVFLFAAAAATAVAQTPQLVALAKFRSYQQTSASHTETAGGGFGAFVAFASAVPGNVVVQLRHPSGTLTALARQPDGTFSVERDFPSNETLEAAFPNGSYAILITGGAATTTTISFNNADVPPTRITNFDALQVWTNSSRDIRWEAIPGAVAEDFLNVAVERPGGIEVFSSPDSFDPRATSLPINGLSAGVGYTGSVNYLRLVYSTANAGATQVASGRGFELRFPIRVVVPAPTITEHPQSRVVAMGDRAQFDVTVRAESGTDYQWRKNGVPIPGANLSRFEIGNVQMTDAGSYSVEVRTSGGTVVSNPAQLLIAPTLRANVHAGMPGSAGANDGSATNARFFAPKGIALGAGGVLYVVDAGNRTIRRVAPDGTVSTVAGTAGLGGIVDGTGAAARFVSAVGIAVDSANNLFVAESENHIIRKITPAGVVTTFAGLLGQPGSQNGVGAGARFRNPTALAVAADGTIYVTDTGNHQIRTITATGVVGTLAGATGNGGYVDGALAAARFNQPQGIAVGPGGTIYVADTDNGAIRTISRAGVVGTFWSGDRLTHRWVGVAVDNAGNVYGSTLNVALARLTPAGAATFLAAGNFYDRVPGVARFLQFRPYGVAVDPAGVMFFADFESHSILRATIEPGSSESGLAITSSPQSHVVATGDSVMLAATATGPAHFYQWRHDGAPIPGANTRSYFLRDGQAAASGRYTVTVSNPIGAITSAPADISFGHTENVGRLANLSIRSAAGAGAQTLIVGVTVGGASASGGKPLLMRGVGPGLTGFGVSGALVDPALGVYRGTELIVANDNWGGGATLSDMFRSVGAFVLAPASRDAALGQNFAAGGYTVQLTGGGSSGIGLAEIYDAQPAGVPIGGMRLTNVSARTQIGVGDDILIAGFVIGGTTSKTVLLRAVGPGLAPFGVTGWLDDPQMSLFRDGALVASNDTAGEEPGVFSAFITVGAFPIASRDAALLVTLAPGNYTVQVRGRDNGTGVGLVELYEMP